MTIWQLAAAILTGVSSVLLLLLAPTAIRRWRTYTGVRSRRQEDVTGRAPASERDVAERVATLEAMGYRALGETLTRTPAGDAFSRILAAPDGAGYAVLVDTPGLAPGFTGFYAAWPAGSWFATIHPHGDPLATADLELVIRSGTLREAEAAHREAVATLVIGRGRPRPVASIADVLALDAEYRARFGGRDLRPTVIRAIAPAVGALVMAMLSLVLLLATR